MKKNKRYIVLSVILMFLTSGISYAETSLDKYGFIEFIGHTSDGDDDYDGLMRLKISGKMYKFNWEKLKVAYKTVYVGTSSLEKGMKVSFRVDTGGGKTKKLTEIKILSENDYLINH